MMATSRIVPGIQIPHPCGDPSLPLERERELRRRLMLTALEAVSQPVEATTIFQSKA
jgi:glycine reductase